MLPLVSDKFPVIWIHFLTYFTSFTGGWVPIGNSYTRDFLVLFLIKLSLNKQMYCGKVYHLPNTLPCPVCGCNDNEPLLQKSPAGPCYDAITSSGGKKKALSSSAETHSPETTPELLAGGSKPGASWASWQILVLAAKPWCAATKSLADFPAEDHR